MEVVEEASTQRDLTGQVEMTTTIPEFGGNYSFVFRGQFKHLQVAIKIIKPVGSRASTMLRKVLRERKVWETLDHPNILPFYGHANDEMFQPFGAFISPWCANGDANRYLEDYGDGLAPWQRMKLWEGVVRGVEYLHNNKPPIIHGDLKPGNVLIESDGTPRICDFGLVRIFLEEGHSGMTTTTEHTGTERYLAPELVRPDCTTIPTIASDIYALGCLGLPLIYGQMPYAHRPNNIQGRILGDIKKGIPPAHSAKRTVLGEHPWLLMSQCWDPEPERRPLASKLLSKEPPVSPFLVKILQFAFSPAEWHLNFSFDSSPSVGWVSKAWDFHTLRTRQQSRGIGSLGLPLRTESELTAIPAKARPLFHDKNMTSMREGSSALTAKFQSNVSEADTSEASSMDVASLFDVSDNQSEDSDMVVSWIADNSQGQETEDEWSPELVKIIEDQEPLNLSGVVSIRRSPVSEAAFGTVFKGYANRGLEKEMRVAVKSLKTLESPPEENSVSENADWSNRIMRQIRVWSAVKHQNLVEFLGYTTECGEYPALVSPWYRNGEAADYLYEHELALDKRVKLTQDVIHGFQYLHHLGIAHGNLKPKNILVSDEGMAKISDFGLVRLFDWRRCRMIIAMSYKGTQRYKAPELASRRGLYQPVATLEGDIYSLGCILLEFIERIEPFQRYKIKHEIRKAVLAGESPSSREERNPDQTNMAQDLSERLWVLMDACWEKPVKRPSLEDIIACLDGLPSL